MATHLPDGLEIDDPVAQGRARAGAEAFQRLDALILISALPLSVDVYADSDNKSNPIILSGDDEDALIAKRKRQKENDQ